MWIAVKEPTVLLLLLWIPGLFCSEISEPQGTSSLLEPPGGDIIAKYAKAASVDTQGLAISQRRNEGNTHKKSSHFRYGYVLTVRYNGQQTAGIRSMLSQQCWIGTSNLPMFVVEPFLQDSYVQAIRAEVSSTRIFTLADYFDMARFESGIQELNYGRLAGWEDFLENAPRNVIFVQTANAKKWRVDGRQVPKLLWKSHSLSECYQFSDKRMKTLLINNNFCTVRVIKIHTTSTVPFTGEELKEYILKGWHPNSVTLVFDKWIGAWHIPHALHSQSACEDVRAFTVNGNLQASKQLIEHAKSYEHLFNLDSKPFRVAVMFRSEHLIITLDKQTFQETFTTCLSEVINMTRYLNTATNMSASKPFVTADIGRYGSTSFHPFVFPVLEKSRIKALKMVERAVVTLFQRNVTFKEWEDSFLLATGHIEDRGYIAALQRTVASRADCLVLFGGGQFLEVALRWYITAHPSMSDRCVHFICVGGRFKKRYESILNLIHN